jgi:heme/copper-type cytochrome/quinol oxidase subunit 3
MSASLVAFDRTRTRTARLARTSRRQPRDGSSNVVFGTLVFLASETMLFAGLVSAFLVLRAQAPAWPPPGQPRLPLGLTLGNLLLLLASGALVGRGAEAARRGQTADALAWLARTAVCGAAFLAVQGLEWARLVEHGIRLAPAIYGGLFAALIGMHGLHVLGGVVVLASVTIAVRRLWIEDSPTAAIRAASLYWRFVVAVWPVLWGLLYLT